MTKVKNKFMNFDSQLIKKLREETGAGVLDCQKALLKTNGDIKKAINLLRAKGQLIASQKQTRKTKDGLIGIYLHSNGRVGSLVAVACETDFVARTDDFKELVHDLAMQVAATHPLYLKPEDVPNEVIEEERQNIKEQLKDEGKSKKILDKIVTGKLNKYFEEVCLLKQPFIKDDKRTIEQLIQEKIAKLGENIQIKDFKRLSL